MEAPSHEVLVSWPLQCSQFNHGWLRNRFCQALGAAIQISGGKVERELPQDVHLTWLQDWLDHEDFAKHLVADFRKEMSPSLLFSFAPLVNLEPSDATFFRSLAHSLWLTRHNIGTRCEQAEAALALAGDQVRELEHVKDLREAIDSGLTISIHAACQDFADSLSQLPKAIEL